MKLLYRVQAAWRGEGLGPEGLAARYLDTLDRIELLHPALRGWSTSEEPEDRENPQYDKLEVLPITQLRPVFGQWLARNAKRNDWGEHDTARGYWLSAANTDPDPSLAGNRAALLEIQGGQSQEEAHFEIGSYEGDADPEVVTYPVFRGIVEALVAVWNPTWVNAKCSIWDQDRLPTPRGEPPFPYSGFQTPWISYLSAERSAGLGELPGLLVERTAAGGLLMSATEERFDPAIDAHLRRSRQIAEIMIERASGPP
jgi:hypothetical protein